MTLTLFFVLAFGFFCGWALLKAAKWLPLVLLVCIPARADVVVWAYPPTVNNGSYNAVYACSAGAPGQFTGVSCSYGQLPQYMYLANGYAPWNVFGVGNETGSPLNFSQACGGAYIYAFTNVGPGTCQLMFGPSQFGGWQSCTNGGGGGGNQGPTVYSWNYTITNDTGLPMQIMWVGAPTNSGLINLGPGQSYTYTNSSGTWGLGGFTSSGVNPDGSLTNISIWPPTPPNLTNQTISGGNTTGGYNPGQGNQLPPGQPGPGAGVGGSGTNLTGNQYYQGVTNLQSSLGSGFGYLGNLIGAQGTLIQMGNGALFSISNGMLTMVGDMGTNITLGNATTNLLTQQTNQLSAVVSNLAVLNSNTVSGFSNMIAALGGGGTNTFSSGDMGSISNSVSTNGDAFGLGLSNAWGSPFAGGGLTNIASGGSNGSYWLIRFPTNPLAAWDYNHPVNDANSGIDLDPRHNAYFNGFALFMRNIEVWMITFLVLWEIREWMSDRLFKALLTPSNSIKLDPAALAQYAVRLAWGGSVLLVLPVAMAAIAYNFGKWAFFESALDPLGSSILAACGTVGPYIGDAISIVSCMIPLAFLGGSVVYLGAVWLGLDVVVAAAMFKLRYS